MDPSQVAQLYPPEYLEADRSRQLLNVAIAFGVLEGIFFILFFYSRLKYHIRSSLDIYLVVLGFLFVFMHVVVDIGKPSSTPEIFSMRLLDVYLTTFSFS